TAAPMPTVPAPAEEPSALALEVLASEEVRVRAPPVELRLEPCEASAVLETRFTATAAATETGTEAPLLSVALAAGTLAPPEPPPAGAWPSAVPCCWVAWPCTLAPPGVEEGAPAALAEASVSVLELPAAVKERAPPALRSRCEVACTWCLARVRPSESPTAAVEPALLEPVALVT